MIKKIIIRVLIWKFYEQIDMLLLRTYNVVKVSYVVNVFQSCFEIIPTWCGFFSNVFNNYKGSITQYMDFINY